MKSSAPILPTAVVAELEPLSSDAIVLDFVIRDPDEVEPTKKRRDPQRSGGGSVNRGDSNKIVPVFSSLS